MAVANFNGLSAFLTREGGHCALQGYFVATAVAPRRGLVLCRVTGFNRLPYTATAISRQPIP